MDMADPGFPQRHPEINGLQGKYGGTGPGSYGVPLGPVFGGVIEEGQVIGFSYL